MRHAGRRDGSHEFEPMQIAADVVEQPLTAAEQHWHDVQLHLVDETGPEILLGRLRSAGDTSLPAAARSLRLLAARHTSRR